MKVDVLEFDDNKVKLVVEGRLDTLTSPDFDAVVEPYLSVPGVNITIDIEKMDFISSSGLRSLIKMLKRINAANGQMSIVGMTPPVKEIFDMTGFSSLFLLLPSLDWVDSTTGEFKYYYLGKKI